MKMLFLHLLSFVASTPNDTSAPIHINRFPDSPTVRILTVYVQLPIARWPGLRRNPFTGSRGLVFVELYASDGKDSARQLLAFRPKSPNVILLGDRPVPATVTDESYQYYHAYLRLYLTAPQWGTMIKSLYQWARFNPYRSHSCNSTHFACALLKAWQPNSPAIRLPDSRDPTDLYHWLQSLSEQVLPDQLHLSGKRQYAGTSYSAESITVVPHNPTIRHE